MERTLTIFDAIGIQDYIFGSNRLRENVVASYLVELATGDWAIAAIQKHAPGRHRPIFRGGGNVAVLFESRDDAKKVVSELTRRILIEAPGLQLVVAHQTFDYAQTALGGENGIYAQTARKLRLATQQRRDNQALPGLSVTRVCRSTGLPAVGRDEEEPDRPVSAEVEAKTNRARRNDADRRLRRFLSDAGVTDELVDAYAFSRELDDLGRSHGDSSYIAVVHADGNGMGQRIADLIATYPNADQNNECIEAIKAFSKALNDAGQTALQATLRRMIIALEDDPAFADLRESLVLAPDGRPYLPLRPIVFGGDDVTIVCDGRLGLTFAATYLEEFDRAAVLLPDEKPGHACAGVAIVKTHYPFARAYALSGELCDEAKGLVRREAARRRAPFDASALDWHLAIGGISAPLESLRERLYATPRGSLVHRPLFRDGLGWEAWDSLAGTISAFQKDEWRSRQNKVLALREALRSGTDATRAFRAAYGVDELPPIAGVAGDDYRRSGWLGDTCAYFDAIEALDFYLPIPAAEALP